MEKKLLLLTSLEKFFVLLIALSSIAILHSIIAVTAHGGFKNFNPYVISLITAGTIVFFAFLAAISVNLYINKNSVMYNKQNTIDEKISSEVQQKDGEDLNGITFKRFFGHTSSNFNMALCLASFLSLMAAAACSGMLMRNIKNIQSFIANMTDFSNTLCIAFYATSTVFVLTLLIHAVKNMIAPEKYTTKHIVFDTKFYRNKIDGDTPNKLTIKELKEKFQCPETCFLHAEILDTIRLSHRDAIDLLPVR